MGQLRCPGGVGCSPIILDLEGEGFRLTDEFSGVAFDLNANGCLETLSWTAPPGENPFLWLDRDLDRIVDDGSELFGDSAPQPESLVRNGYAALAVFDLPASGGDGDGSITPRDRVFSRLQLWFDRNHDGLTQSREVVRLGDAGVRSISLDYVDQRVLDPFGNVLRWSSTAELRSGRVIQTVDVLFVGGVERTPCGR